METTPLALSSRQAKATAGRWDGKGVVILGLAIEAIAAARALQYYNRNPKG